MDAVGAVQLQNIAVVREEANRLVRPPRQQSLEIGNDGRKRGLHRTYPDRQAFLGLGFEASRQLLDGVGQQRHAAQVEQLQCAIGLMDLVARIAQAVDVLLVREEALQAVDGLRQRRPDLVDDPGERRNVRRRADQLVGVMCLRHLSSLSRHGREYPLGCPAVTHEISTASAGDFAQTCRAGVALHSQPPQPTRNRATEALSSRASVASWPIDCAAWRVPCEVCSVTARMRSIDCATPPAELA